MTKGQTKNKEARNLHFDDELLKLITMQRMRLGDCPYVFHRDGKKISNLVKSWKKACKMAHLGGRLFHDFRKTAARNLTRSGTKETIALKITGYKARSVFIDIISRMTMIFGRLAGGGKPTSQRKVLQKLLQSAIIRPKAEMPTMAK